MHSKNQSAKDLHDQIWDVVILGAGYAGWGALQAALAAGKKALVVAHMPALLPESGWSFQPENGACTDPLWTSWLKTLVASGAAKPPLTDGALAEVSAAHFCRENEVPILLYSQPVVAETVDSFLESVLFASKSGLQRVQAKRWLDATEEGSLVKLISPDWCPAQPSRLIQNLYLRHSGPTVSETAQCLVPGLNSVCLLPGIWPDEARLRIELDASICSPRNAWIPALQALKEHDLLKDPVLTHGSLVPFYYYAENDAAEPPALPDNLAICVPGAIKRSLNTLGDRFVCGVQAYRSLEGKPECKPRPSGRPPAIPNHLPEPGFDVVVAGLGTGGSLAAVAAARSGARVLGFDSLPFAGGISSGGGIHSYYYGIKGGLQQELDERVRQLTPLFGKTSQVKGFHPDAKKIVLESMLHEAGVSVRFNETMFSVGRDQNKISHVLVASPSGPLRLSSKLWIDATGDGDLCAGAGVPHRLGRSGDGLLHAYSQSSGKAVVKNEVPIMELVNFDAGFCNPTDVGDLTRSRIEGVAQHAQTIYTGIERPTYIAPAIGLRQSRHIETDYTLTLDDLITRKSFPDSIGYTGAHYDNHAHDYENESDEAAFWVWGCLQWATGSLACELPYRILLPKELDNAIIACRALGVSEEAHHSVRMQRDMQRIGEVAGLAAAICLKTGKLFREVPMDQLCSALVKSGALSKEALPSFSMDGCVTNIESLEVPAESLEEWIHQIQQPMATPSLWRIYQAGKTDPSIAPRVQELLESEDSIITWRVAVVLAMWGHASAEPRLLNAVLHREMLEETREFSKPQHAWKTVPRWQAALIFLRRCASEKSLPVLLALSGDPTLNLNQRVAVATLCLRLCNNPAIRETSQNAMSAILDNLLSTAPPHAVREPGSKFSAPKNNTRPDDKRAVIDEDFTWQLHAAVSQVHIALGLPVDASYRRYFLDPRRLVRSRFEKLLPTSG
jgi:hypothetical protein